MLDKEVGVQEPLRKDEVDLIYRWESKNQEVENGLSVKGAESENPRVRFDLNSLSSSDEDYPDLLRAKVYEVFGVSNINLAHQSFIECVTLFSSHENIRSLPPKEAQQRLKVLGEHVLSIFQELRPRDAIELMLVTKLIIMDRVSNLETIRGASSYCEHTRTTSQNRGIKASRLFLELKEKLDKHRRPEQRILVQHNHIHNEGQAIIGSQISTGGGEELRI